MLLVSFEWVKGTSGHHGKCVRTYAVCPCLLFSDLASSYLQGLLLLLFLTELELGLLDVFLKMLGTDSKLANYPHSQPLQLALLGCSSWPDPYKAATGKEALFSGTGSRSETPACSSQLSKECIYAHSLPSNSRGFFDPRFKWVQYPGHRPGNPRQERVFNVRKDQGCSAAMLTWQEHEEGRRRCLLENLQDAKPAGTGY